MNVGLIIQEVAFVVTMRVVGNEVVVRYRRVYMRMLVISGPDNTVIEQCCMGCWMPKT
jgi:hypothetical protein